MKQYKLKLGAVTATDQSAQSTKLDAFGISVKSGASTWDEITNKPFTTVDETEFDTSADKLSVKEVGQEKVTGLKIALDKKKDKTDVTLGIKDTRTFSTIRVKDTNDTGEPISWDTINACNIIELFSSNINIEKTMEEAIRISQGRQNWTNTEFGVTEFDTARFFTNGMMLVPVKIIGETNEDGTPRVVYIVSFIYQVKPTFLYVTNHGIIDDAKWIPPQSSNVDLGITGATIGQIIEVEAIDENGIPTKWKAVEKPSGGGGEHVKKILGTLTLAEQLDGYSNITIPLNDDPFKYTSLLLTIKSEIPSGQDAKQYQGFIYNMNTRCQICHLNTLIPKTGEFDADVNVTIYANSCYSTASVHSGGYQWNTTKAGFFTFPFVSKTSNQYGLYVENFSAVAGSIFILQGVM